MKKQKITTEDVRSFLEKFNSRHSMLDKINAGMKITGLSRKEYVEFLINRADDAFCDLFSEYQSWFLEGKLNNKFFDNFNLFFSYDYDSSKDEKEEGEQSEHSELAEERRDEVKSLLKYFGI